jgi:ferrous-iron efflux pump FieF
VELPGGLSLSQAHALCEEVAVAIRQEFPQTDVLVHADPYETPLAADQGDTVSAQR